MAAAACCCTECNNSYPHFIVLLSGAFPKLTVTGVLEKIGPVVIVDGDVVT